MITEVLEPSLKNSSISIHNIKKFCKGYVCDWHIHNECEIFMLIDGEKKFYVNDKEYILTKGDIIFVNERVPHKTKVTKDSPGFLLQAGMGLENVNKYLFRYISRSGADSALFKAGTEINRQLYSCIDSIIRENENRLKSYDMFIKADVLKMFSVLYRYDIIKDPLSYFNTKNITRIIPVLDYIEAHYSEEVSLEQMSRLLNVDKSHFCRIFKKAVNTSFIQYLNFVRVCKAERLLLSTDKTIFEIAEETGFSSATYFAEVFKLNMSCSPSYYKKIKLEARNENN